MIYTAVHDVFAKGKDEKDKWIKGSIRSVSPLTLIPVVSSLQDMAIDGYLGHRINTTMTPIGGIADAYSSMLEKVSSRKARTQQKLEAGAHLLSYAVPYPDQINRWIFNTADYVNRGMSPRIEDILQRRPMKQRR